MAERGWTRREFVKAVAASGAVGVCTVDPRLLWPAAAADPEEVFRAGFIVPDAGPLAEDGKAARLGAELGAAEAARLAELFGKRFELVTVRAEDLESAAGAARGLVEDGRVFAVAGGLGATSCFDLAELCERHGLLFFNVGCADDRLRRERCRRTTFSVEASTAMYVDALAGWLIGEAGLRRWHFVTESSDSATAVYRRARQALLEQGGDDLGNTVVRPGTVNHRPTLERLQRVRPDVAFLSLGMTPRAAFLTQYNQLGPAFEVAGPSMSTAQLWIAAPDTRAGIWPTLWHHKLFRYGAQQLNDRFKDRSDRPLDARGWASWMAVKIMAETVLRAGTTETSRLVKFLEEDGAHFDGHKGKRLSFRSWDHQLRQPVYLVRARSGAQDAWDAFEGVAELPLGRPGPERTSQELLDQLGDLESETECRFASG